MGFTSSAGSPLGTTIQTAEIDDASISYIKLGSDFRKWKLLETISASASASETTSETITGYTEFMVVGYNIIGSANTIDLGIQFNADTGANYGFAEIANTTITQTTGATRIDLCRLFTAHNTGFRAVFPASCAAVATGKLCLDITQSCGSGSNNLSVFNGQWAGGNATAITSMTFLMSANAYTGTIEVYAR